MLAQHLGPWDDGLNWLFEQGPDCSHLYSEECLGAKSYWLNHGEFPEGRDCQAYSTGWGWKQGKYAVWTFVLASSFFKGGLELSPCTIFWCFHGKLCTEVLSTVNLFFWWEDSPSVMPFLPSQGESWWKAGGPTSGRGVVSVHTVSPALRRTCPKCETSPSSHVCPDTDNQTKSFSTDWVILLTKQWSQLVSN